MQLFVKRYFKALATLLAAMGIYCGVVVPWIEPEGRAEYDLPPQTSPVALNRSWEGFFEPGSWQTQSPSLLQSKRGTLLAKSWEQSGPKTLELRPLTIIIPASRDTEPGDDSDGQPADDIWIVSAEEGATIEFEKSFDAKSEPVPSIESGTLSGKIHITRKSLRGGTAPPWSLLTSNVYIESNRIHTSEQVRIDSGESIILGRGLRISLLGDIFSGSAGNSTRWGPLDTLEVDRIEKVHVALDPGGLWKGLSGSSSKEEQSLDDLPAHLEVNCNGRFTFDFRRRTATLDNGVQVHQFLGNAFRDEFACQELVATFLPEDTSKPGDTEASQQIEVAGMGLESIVATGVDQVVGYWGEKKVELKAPSIGAFASAKRLFVDFVQQQVELDGKLASAGAAQASAWLKYGEYQFLAPRIAYDANGKETGEVEHLGYLVADGPGEMNVSAKHEMGATQIRWKDLLTMEPTDNPSQHLVKIQGSTLVESRKYGFVTSEVLNVWLTKKPQVEETGQALSEQYRPTHIVAKDRVTITSDAMVAVVDYLKLGLVFVESQLPQSHRDGELSLENSNGQGMYQWVAPKRGAAAGPGTLAGQAVPLSGRPGEIGSLPFAGSTGKSQPPVNIHGKSLETRLVLAGKESWIDDLQMTGPLTLSRPQSEASPPGSPQAPSWLVEGGQLGLVTSPSGDVNLQVSGQPARIVVGGGELTGPSINFDQKTNLVWMDHPGTFSILEQNRSSVPLVEGSSSPLDAAAKIRWIGTPQCTWKGNMYFDGRIVHIKDGVEFKGRMRGADDHSWYVQSKSDHLRIFMDAPVDMKSPSAHQAAMDRLELDGNVLVHAMEYDGLGDMLNYAVVTVPKLAMHVKTNQVVGDGPGSIQSWNQVARSRPTSGSAVAANGQPVQQPLSGSHLVFRDHVVGFLDRNEVVFESKVEVANGPLASIKETINLDQLRRLSLGQMRVECDQLRVYDTSQLPSNAQFSKTSKSTWNLQAGGNVGFEGIVESGHYRGTGSRIVYEQAKQHIVLEGDARRDAEVTQTSVGGTQPNAYTSIRKAVVDMETLEVRVLSLGEGGAGVGAGIPAPGRNTLPPGGNRPPINGPQPRSAVTDFLNQGR